MSYTPPSKRSTLSTIMTSKLALFFVTMATFAKISNAVYLPMEDNNMHRVNRLAHGRRMALKAYSADISNVATQYREPLASSGPGKPKSAIGTVFAKWLVSEYNREGVSENKIFKLLSEPTSSCEANMDQCQVAMQIQKVTCDAARGVYECIPTDYDVEMCVATFDMGSLTLDEPVICDNAEPDSSDESDSYNMLNSLIREGAKKSQPKMGAGSFAPKALFEKKWGVDDGKTSPI